MGMSKHTPGPWTLEIEEERIPDALIWGPEDDPWRKNGDPVAKIMMPQTSSAMSREDHLALSGNKTALANARLISAAPDLLEALEAVLFDTRLRKFQLGPIQEQKARAAIAKAKGE
jgi:hypothetical protein